ncbi:UDP-glucose dehydrogenase family protein [Candidatus Nanohalobium constans]|uniref:UDP-glucose 6-dehydrogenase n=1 Tax=Candidatus Nanohalobium constans TaxID=2565781 RepID=A0A5Q0UJB9_9ARCH|nr:UDP-glucose/GDP-mannose dehydrogenase family protein [Candidatus Nanohalobium constans]QGA81055.1 UDP-glucose 6-dehydrogenase [Candidatus Nanohalobium constans]
MHISVVGTGYVGLPAGTGLASRGNQVTCIDIDEEKVEKINNGDCPIYEEDLPELLEEMVSQGKLSATTNTAEAVADSDITFLAVGTPMNNDGSINLEYIKQAAEDAAEGIKEKDGYHVFVVKSTVVPTTTEEEIIPILEVVSGKKAGEDFGVCMNPEFLREGTALNDFLEPDRIVIGELDEKSGDTLEKVYSEFDAPIMRTSLKAAELIKYASNSLLATKISFINEIGNLCKELGIDVYEVADGVGMDHRVKRDFLDSGAGFGGSCFPKDVRALASFMEDQGEEPRILEDTISVNEDQKTKLVEQLEDHYPDLSGKKIAVLGLSFKPGTDDIRQSPAIDIISELKELGAQIKAYDPKAIENMKEKHPDVEYTSSYEEALEDTDAGLIVTDWDEFNAIDRGDLQTMNKALLLEGRRMSYDVDEENREGITWP